MGRQEGGGIPSRQEERAKIEKSKAFCLIHAAKEATAVV
jgi:hypothetical protein